MRKRLFILCAFGMSLLCGCMGGGGFQAFAPGESLEYGGDMLGDAPAGSWLWVRGKATGDISAVPSNSSSPVEDEAVLVTVQRGAHDATSTMSSASIVLCRADRKMGKRRLLARQAVYDANSSAMSASQPEEALGNWTNGGFTDATLACVDLNDDGCLDVVATFWRKVPEGDAALHCGYTYKNNALVEIFRIGVLQPKAGFTTKDYDQDGLMEAVFPMAQFAPRAEGARKAPEWRCVLAATAGAAWPAKYVQRNADFSAAYDDVLLAHHEDLAIIADGSQGNDLGVLQLDLGLIYSYRKDYDLARKLLAQASSRQGKVGEFAKASLSRIANLPAKDAAKEGAKDSKGEGQAKPAAAAPASTNTEAKTAETGVSKAEAKPVTAGKSAQPELQ